MEFRVRGHLETRHVRTAETWADAGHRLWELPVGAAVPARPTRTGPPYGSAAQTRVTRTASAMT